MNNRAIFSLFLLTVFFSACSSADYRGKSGVSNEAMQKKCDKFIESYLFETRGWQRKDYKVIQQRSNFGGRGYSIVNFQKPALDAFLSEELPGEEWSFHLEVDKSCKKKVAELGYQ
jgi:hypothetical protein